MGNIDSITKCHYLGTYEELNLDKFQNSIHLMYSTLWFRMRFVNNHFEYQQLLLKIINLLNSHLVNRIHINLEVYFVSILIF